MSTCIHPVLTEVGSGDKPLVNGSFTGVDIEITGQPGNVTGMFMWKKYTCAKCDRLITILQAVVEK